MIKVLLFDLSNTLLFAKDTTYVGGLNNLNNQLKAHNPHYNFNDHFELDYETLTLLRNLKQNYQISLFTSETIQNEPAIKDTLEAIFSPIFSALDIGCRKTDPEAYQIIAQKLNVAPEEILFFDDNQQNIAAARASGLDAVVYIDHQQLEKTLTEVLSKTQLDQKK